MSEYAVTKAGTKLPLMSLKNKPYLQVAHRLVWLNEEAARFDITTNILKADKDESIVQAKVNVYEADGKLLRSATATKREDTAGFKDAHLEKAETGAIGRALALLGFGTQFTTQDLDEGTRLADSPTTPAVKATAPRPAPKLALTPAPASPVAVEAHTTAVNVTTNEQAARTATNAVAPTTAPTRSSFRKPSTAATPAPVKAAGNDAGWE